MNRNQPVPILRRFGLPRRLAGWVMLAVLAVQVAASGLAFSAPPRDLALDDHLIVCTAGGMVDLGRAETPNAPLAAEHGGLCVFCLPLLHAAAPAAAIGPIEPAFIVRGIESAPEAGAPARRPLTLAGSASPQAPPSS